MVSVTHGTRQCYRSGCRLPVCRAANADYWRAWWQDKQAGRQRLQARISPIEARKRVKQLQVEGMCGVEIVRRLGLKYHALVLHPDAITVRKALQIRRLYRLTMLEGPDAPLDQPNV